MNGMKHIVCNALTLHREKQNKLITFMLNKNQCAQTHLNKIRIIMITHSHIKKNDASLKHLTS